LSFALKYENIFLILHQKLEYNMAVFVKTIPTLHGSVADRFNEQAHTSEVNRASVDYTEQVESMRAILKESKLY
jgi:hypothetical protein